MDYGQYCIVCWFFKPVFQIQVGGLVLPALLHPQVPPSLALSSILATQTLALGIVVQVGFQFSMMIMIITVAILADRDESIPHLAPHPSTEKIPTIIIQQKPMISGGGISSFVLG